MTIDFDALVDAPVYSTFGRSASVTPLAGVTATLTVLDRIEAIVEESASGAEIPTTRPAIEVRLAELAEKGLTRTDLEKAEVSFEGQLYRVYATQPVGDRRNLQLILIEND